MKTILVRPVTKTDYDWIVQFIAERWHSARVVSRGRVIDASGLPGFIVLKKDKPVGLATYRIYRNECELVTIDSIEEGVGVGSALIDAVRAEAIRANCIRLWLVTTNDNLPALRFYQKRGFVFVALYCKALQRSRELKPEIPLKGLYDIPLRDELELEMRFQ